MTEQELQGAVAAHGRRNEALLKRLGDLGVPLEEPRPIDLHFWIDPTKTSLLAQELRRRGMEPGACKAAARGELSSMEATVRIAPATVVSILTEDLVRMSASLGGAFDGWGTTA